MSTRHSIVLYILMWIASIYVNRIVSTRVKDYLNKGMPKLLLHWLAGNITQDCDIQCTVHRQIRDVLGSEFDECIHPDHTCSIFSDGGPVLCNSVYISHGLCIVEVAHERGQGGVTVTCFFYLAVGPTLDRIRNSLLKVAKGYDNITTTLGEL